MLDEQQLGAGDQQIAKEFPIVGQLIHTGKVAGAIAVIASLLGVIMGAVGYRVVGPPQDVQRLEAKIVTVDTSLRRRIDTIDARTKTATDSLLRELREIRETQRNQERSQELSSFIQCVTVRRLAPDLRPPGCDAVETRQSRQGRIRP